jgi:hypothetical protein
MSDRVSTWATIATTTVLLGGLGVAGFLTNPHIDANVIERVFTTEHERAECAEIERRIDDLEFKVDIYTSADVNDLMLLRELRDRADRCW